MSAVFGAIGRKFWPVTLTVGVAALVLAALGDNQAMAILACIFGALLMWEAERHPGVAGLPAPALPEAPG
jgi:hypothetical protein